MLDALDYSILTAIVIAVITYLARSKISNFFANTPETATKSLHSRSIHETLTSNNKSCIVFYGSQTGTAEDYSHKLASEIQSRFSIPSLSADLNDYDYDTLNELDDDALVIFMLATYGEGEPTDNALDFVDALTNDLDNLDTLNFAIFGLGNSTYEFYNQVATDINKKLLELGANSIIAMGLGDDGKATMDEDYLNWKESLFNRLKENHQEHDLIYNPSISILESQLSIKSQGVALGEPNSKYLDISKIDGPYDLSNPYLSPIIKTKELFEFDQSQQNSRSCIHLEFQIPSHIKYTTGDHIAIHPSNPSSKVDHFLYTFGLTNIRDKVIDISKIDDTITIHFPTPTTYETIIRYFMEISGAVSRSTLKAFVQFSPNDEIRTKLSEICNDKDIFNKFVSTKQLDLSDLLLCISGGLIWSTVPFTFLIENISNMSVRYYSICTSSGYDKGVVGVCAAVENNQIAVDNTTQKILSTAYNSNFEKMTVSGVTTNLFKNISGAKDIDLQYDLNGPHNLFKSENDYKLPIHIRRSTFKLPSNPQTPIILIGPGTGVAPFRGFIRERISQLSKQATIVENPTSNKKKEPKGKGEIVLFYGTQTPQTFLYKDEWEDYKSQLPNFKMHTAFSRPQDPSKKQYVQDLISLYSSEINDLLEKGAFVYVCGDASKMSKDVFNCFVDVIVKERELTKDVADGVIRGLKVVNRYQEDVW